jgi:hypothetical protein
MPTLWPCYNAARLDRQLTIAVQLEHRVSRHGALPRSRPWHKKAPPRGRGQNVPTFGND